MRVKTKYFTKHLKRKKENRKISELEKEKLNIFEILKLLKKPLLIKRFFSVCKNEGIKIAFEKFINKVEKVKVNKRDENMVISLEQILSNIEKKTLNKGIITLKP